MHVQILHQARLKLEIDNPNRELVPPVALGGIYPVSTHCLVNAILKRTGESHAAANQELSLVLLGGCTKVIVSLPVHPPRLRWKRSQEAC